MPFTIEQSIDLCPDDRETIGEALAFGFDDQNNYLQTGSPSVDYGDEWPDVKSRKQLAYRRIGDLAERLGLHGERERWQSLADSLDEHEEDSTDAKG